MITERRRDGQRRSRPPDLEPLINVNERESEKDSRDALPTMPARCDLGWLRQGKRKVRTALIFAHIFLALPHDLWMNAREDRPTPRSPRPGRVPPRRG